MYFIRRALKYLRRKIGKTILMGVIFLIIANFVLAGLLIRQASINAQEQTRLSIGADITYTPNWENFVVDVEKGVIDRGAMRGVKGGNGIIKLDLLTEKGAPTYGNIMTAAASDYVGSYQLTMPLVGSADLAQVQLESDGINNGQFIMNHFDGDVPSAFSSGEASITQGQMISDEALESGTQVIVMSQTLAEQNNLKVGDTVTLTYPEVDGQIYRLDFEIVGTYTTTEEVAQSAIQNGDVRALPENRLYMPVKVLAAAGHEESFNHIIIENNIIRLNDPDDIDAYRAEVAKKMEFSYGILDANDYLYNSLVGPIEVVGTISNVAVTIILITGGIIIGLITALTVNERRGEIGVLLAVGETKAKIVSQFVVEVLVIAILTFTLSIFTGGIIGDALGESAMGSELLQTQQELNEPQMGSGKREYYQKELGMNIPDEVGLDISLSPDVILNLFGMGIGLAIISTIIPALYVMRFNPKQILANRHS